MAVISSLRALARTRESSVTEHAAGRSGIELVRVRFWGEAIAALGCSILAILTVFWRDWIEGLTGFDPDRHSGSIEWLIVAGLTAVCLLMYVAAHAEWRRALATPDASA